MAVLRKEYYTQKNGVDIIKVIVKPTKVFPEGGYFYCPREAESLVDSYCWSFYSQKRAAIRAGVGDQSRAKDILFHKELFKFYHQYDWQGDIDHINHIEFDNIDQNLNAVTRQQNQFNKLTKGYIFSQRDKYFCAVYKINGKVSYPFSVTYREDEACIQANYIDQVVLRDKLGSDYYMFDFKKYRRGSKDILDLERRGIITEEEATYRHILRYSSNAWYYLRYGLEQYFKENRIPIPEYNLNEQGFMVDKITGKKLCPFNQI